MAICVFVSTIETSEDRLQLVAEQLKLNKDFLEYVKTNYKWDYSFTIVDGKVQIGAFDRSRLDEFFQAGVDVNFDEEGSLRSVLMYAAFNDSIEIVKALLNRGADINQQDIFEYNALSYALIGAARRNVQGIRELDLLFYEPSKDEKANKVVDYLIDHGSKIVFPANGRFDSEEFYLKKSVFGKSFDNSQIAFMKNLILYKTIRDMVQQAFGKEHGEALFKEAQLGLTIQNYLQQKPNMEKYVEKLHGAKAELEKAISNLEKEQNKETIDSSKVADLEQVVTEKRNQLEKTKKETSQKRFDIDLKIWSAKGFLLFFKKWTKERDVESFVHMLLSMDIKAFKKILNSFKQRAITDYFYLNLTRALDNRKDLFEIRMKGDFKSLKEVLDEIERHMNYPSPYYEKSNDSTDSDDADA